MAAGDLIMALVEDGNPVFPCGGCNALNCEEFIANETLTLVLSGLTGCEECSDVIANSIATGVPGIDGSYELVKVESEPPLVRFAMNIPNAISIETFLGPDCTGDSSTETYEILLAVECVDGLISVIVKNDFGPVFLAENKPGGYAFANDLTGCGTYEGLGIIGFGGNASFSFP